ncbi:methylated-DNA--protein-cysteine methyltransferase [Lysobacter soli]|uniref:Methylated-DNA--protein-cysteine methyltransferase n=1 Tax=Lysobacter soli TaxID=453783 RepID=A0A3D8VJV6_9GAMM|nr:methylated-DNA--protein-cysteine methyltransferase [Lysobacter soli]
MGKPAADDAHGRILAAIRAIPAGEVAGYGEVARRAGLPGRARLVARLLGQNEDPALPWHRVLRSDGRIAFPEGSKGFREQSQRLRAEGVCVESGKVKGQRAAATLDEQMWGMPMSPPAARKRSSAATKPTRAARKAPTPATTRRATRG